MKLLRPLGLVGLLLAAQCAAPRSDTASRPLVAEATQASSWSTATPPIRIRTGHTATLLGTGEILVAGGGATPSSTELIDALSGTVTLGADLAQPRTFHTATMLLSGKVLLAGGTAQSSAELFDPITRTSTPTGSMTKVRHHHSAVRLRSGKVLLVGSDDYPDVDLTNEIYDPATGTFSRVASRTDGIQSSAAMTLADGRVLVNVFSPTIVNPETPAPVFNPNTNSWSTAGFYGRGGDRTLTLRYDGSVAIHNAIGCNLGGGGGVLCDSTASIFKTTDTAAAVDLPLNQGRSRLAAARTPNGDVLFVGGDPDNSVREVQKFTAADPSVLEVDGTLTAGHVDPTATIIPGGDVIVVGGSQAAVSRRITFGAWKEDPAFTMKTPRRGFVSTRLHDGTVLLTGGDRTELGETFAVLASEIVDAKQRKTTTIAAMTTPRMAHAGTTLRSGQVLITGGQGRASAELFTPGSPPTFTAVPASMASERANHTATLLPSGHVLIAGGTASTAPVTPLDTAELFDPDTMTFLPLPKMTRPRTKHGAVLMSNGLVLLVSEATAEIFDPVARTFRATTGPGASRDGRTAHVLANGRVFVTGGPTLAADLFDPITERWSFSGSQPSFLDDMTWTMSPSGVLVGSGGLTLIRQFVTYLPLVFDPLATTAGEFALAPTNPNPRWPHGAALAGTGEVLSMGGDRCIGNCITITNDTIATYGDDAPTAVRPQITGVQSKVIAGERITINGARFANVPEASDGTTHSSAVNHPLAIWVADAGDVPVRSTILDFTDTTATWIVPTTSFYGHGQLFISVAGVMSYGASVEIAPAPQALTCQFDAQCTSGFCSDNVCCDKRCDGVCEGCSAARKGRGEDGVCGAVPPGRDPNDKCELRLGEACTEKAECAGSAFCSQGVCCDSTCEGTCLSCTIAGKVGQCTAVNDGQCGSTCDGDHTLKQVGAPDLDCAPYKCAGPACNTSCTSARDCVAPSVCDFNNKCVVPVTPSPGDDVVCSSRPVGTAGSIAFSVPVLGMLAAVGFLRRRRSKR